MKVSAAVFVLSLGACATSDGPAMSVAWDPVEGVRYLLAQGRLPAVAETLAVKAAIDRGSAMSRVRTLETSPLNDPPGTPAYALLSGASVVITGTPERCRVASSDGSPAKLRETALSVIENDPTWVVVRNLPGDPLPAGTTGDALCKQVADGVLLASLLTAEVEGAALKFQAVVSRSSASTCASAQAPE